MTGSNETSTPKREQLAFNWQQGEKVKFDAALDSYCERTGQRVPAREFILALIERASGEDSAEQLAARLRELGVDQLLDAHYQRRAADERLVVAIADAMEAMQTEKRQVETDLLNASAELITLKAIAAGAASKDEQLAGLKKEAEQLAAALEDERARHSETARAHADAMAATERAEAAVTSLTTALDAAQTRIEELDADRSRERDTARTRIDELTATLEGAQAALEDERASHSKTAQDAQAVVSAHNAAQAEIARLTTALEAAKKRIDELDADRVRERELAQRMTTKADSLERELNSQNAARASITAERDTAKAEIERLAVQVAELRKDADKKQADMVDVRAELITAWNEKAAAEARAQAQLETIDALKEALATVRTFNAPETVKKEKQAKAKGQAQA